MKYGDDLDDETIVFPLKIRDLTLQTYITLTIHDLNSKSDPIGTSINLFDSDEKLR